MKFRKTEQAILRVLADGKPHKREELHACLPDDMAPLSNIQQHISNIRKVLRPLGQDIVCVFVGRTFQYQHVRLLASAVDGRR